MDAATADKSVIMDSRLKEITRCTDELEYCRTHYALTHLDDRLGTLAGELDWLEELHRVLYDDIAG